MVALEGFYATCNPFLRILLIKFGSRFYPKIITVFNPRLALIDILLYNSLDTVIDNNSFLSFLLLEYVSLFEHYASKVLSFPSLIDRVK